MSQGYPEGLRAHLDIGPTPPCDVCHRAASEPVGAADQPFSTALVARGLQGNDDASLFTSLDRMQADGVDSDGDGARDLDELSWGGDPNVADVLEAQEHEPPSYGCAVTGAHGPLDFGLFLALLLLFVGRPRRPR